MRDVAELGAEGGRGLVAVDVGAVGGLAGGGDGVVSSLACVCREDGGGVGGYLGEGGEGDDGVGFLEGGGDRFVGGGCWGGWGSGGGGGVGWGVVTFVHFVVGVEFFVCLGAGGWGRRTR